MMDYHIGFLLEQTLGHVTHSMNIQRFASGDAEIRPAWMPIYYEMGPLEGRIPYYNRNWSLRAGWKARRSLRKLKTVSSMDGLFIHTQVLGVMIPDWIRRFPTVVSMDATPLQYDKLGDVYGHSQDSARMEQIKFRMNQRMFNLASHLVTWTSWAKESLVADYGIPAGKITVIPPGVDLERFSAHPMQPQSQKGGPVKILFVGGDLKRKGGYLLLDAFRILRQIYPEGSIELHLVTYSNVPQETGVFIYRDIRPGDERLIEQFASADIFTLPTEGDCLPMVLSEAGASGLPSISTRVGGIPEIVIDGETGILIDPKDEHGLVKALDRLVNNTELRRGMGKLARHLIQERHNAGVNIASLLELIKKQADAARDVHAMQPERSMRRV